jgi:hypothetical protein
MARTKTYDENHKPRSLSPATTPEANESRITAKAMTLVEKQIDEGTVSPSVLVHFLKLTTEKERLEREKLESENNLLRAKAKAVEAAEQTERKYAAAIAAMRTYSGNGATDDDDEIL